MIGKEDLKKIYDLISELIDISEQEWSFYSNRFKKREVKKNEIILNAGSVCRYAFFVNTGLLRIFYSDNDGSEKTFHFAMENTFATDYESLLKRTPADYSIQAQEDSVLILMSLDMLESGYKELQQGEKLGRRLAEDYFFLMSDKIKSIYTQSPHERYDNMNKKYPGILQRVPQHFIASYLNISPVHLSRLKNS
ncbi:MAG: Crp/Fnr family transcriptional regulator [Bacteroidota bacterium]|nr:Crp/Fnr family transcriptional regulator [Bacteroidota bacterium]